MTGRSKPIIVVVVVLLALVLAAQETNNTAKGALPLPGAASRDSALPITVTYIANDGFLIDAAGKKVLIDALFDAGAPNYLAPSPELLDRIVTGKGPFADIDILLVTHAHGDHFSPAIVLRYLRAHPRCQLVAHRQAIDKLRGDESYKDVQKQVHELNLEPGARGQLTLNGIVVSALRLNHSQPHTETRNLVFAVDLGGARFLHMGDAFLSEPGNEVCSCANCTAVGGSPGSPFRS
jgi:L-ascorbate metabolism protein UlaG (beta-lactamase superfamily)